MTMLHRFFWAAVKWGKSERGEKCAGCKRYLPTNTTCLVLRLANDDSKRLYGPPIEIWCETCTDLLAATGKIRPGMEGPVRLDNAGEFGEIGDGVKWEWISPPRPWY